MLKESRVKVFDILEQIPISVLLSLKKRGEHATLLDVHESTTLEEVLDLLSDANILAVPVYKNNETNLNAKMFTGIVSVYDILVWTVFQKMFDSLEEMEKDVTEKFQDYIRVSKAEDAFFSTPVGELVGLTPESNHPFTLHSSDCLASLLKVFTSGAYHRVLIIDDLVLINSALESEPAVQSESAVCLLSQSDLVRFVFEMALLSKNDSVLPETCGITQARQKELGKEICEILNVPVKDAEMAAIDRWAKEVLGLTEADATPKERRVVKVSDSVSAIAAFRTLYVNQVSAVAVVEDHGGMIANLSASDLRGMTKDSLESLASGVFEFLEKYSKRTPYQIKADQLRSVLPEETLYNAVGMTVESKIHRVWVVDPNDKPVGLLTLTDILGVFVPSAEELL